MASSDKYNDTSCRNTYTNTVFNVQVRDLSIFAEIMYRTKMRCCVASIIVDLQRLFHIYALFAIRGTHFACKKQFGLRRMYSKEPGMSSY